MKLFFTEWFRPRQLEEIIELKQTTLVCPSFDDEPWKSRAEKLRPTSLDAYTQGLLNFDAVLPPPLPLSSPYVKLLLKFLDTVPKECWIDEENEED